ncbi:methyltransferase domain-containing protein [Oscillatoria sp. FACHB-1407]|uniref:class I SAM-dependent methyltransferase n=1 Tax=Oscillatoria sp. FACHB-1407 TaxID=2692847 RepID=UPI001684E6C2|nr:class I SAM-dependent methyltransferase [Oscillatoria sp. FACHB-1407]MBD2465341.1 methyltransferase domain-containing protein [Oscillatoria sp. FACHB-1407]
MTDTHATDTNATVPPLYTQNPLERFSDRADDYAKYRPRYPQEAIATLFDSVTDPTQCIIADVGAGTGISSRLLADQGATVWAIEPNAAMRESAAPHPRVKFHDATAEATGLSSQSVDLVTCCQSFHWFEPIATLAEFHRILKPGGRVALMWNDRDLSDPLMVEYTNLVSAASEAGFFERRDRKSPNALANSLLFQNFRTYTFPYKHPLSLEGLIGLASSASYVIKTGATYEQLIAGLQGLHQQWQQDGFVPLSYQTYLYVAEKQG